MINRRKVYLILVLGLLFSAGMGIVALAVTGIGNLTSPVTISSGGSSSVLSATVNNGTSYSCSGSGSSWSCPGVEVAAGGSISYSVVISNAGKGDAVVSLNPSCTGSVCSDVSFGSSPSATISPGAQATLSIDASATASATVGSSFTVTLSATQQ